MIRYIYADDLKNAPVLSESMFRDRAEQFKRRLNWDVTVNEAGWECDEYDQLNPLYIIWEEADGTHGGSLRVMPSVGRIMTNEHFLHLTDGVRIASPFIWESTRFCLSPGASPKVAAALLGAAVEGAVRFGLEQSIGVIYTRTLPIYRRIGYVPDVIGSDGEGRDSISICAWEVSEDALRSISERSGIPVWQFADWFDASFDASFNENAAEEHAQAA